MFDRKKYKDFAKKQLKGRWGVPVLMTFLSLFIMELFNIPTYMKIFSHPDFLSMVSAEEISFQDIYFFTQSINNITNSGSLISRIILVVADAIISFALINVYLKMSRSPEKVSFSLFFEGLNNWLKAILAGLWQFLWVTLWTFLFIIPGIVKAIAYSQMYYILLEYEDVSVRKAMKISMIITKGHKADLFVTYLSFLGWAILCALTAGIGTLWLEPYMEMTLVNAYHALMKEAIDDGRIKLEDLKNIKETAE